MSISTDPWEPLGEAPCEPAPALNDELAREAQRVELGALRTLAARGTKHDPEL